MFKRKNYLVDNNTIGELARFVGNEIDYLNSGGCGVFAVELYKRLKALDLGVEPQLWILSSLSSSEARYLEIREILKASKTRRTLGQFNDYNWYLSHVVVEFAGGWFDGTGFYRDYESLNGNWGCMNRFRVEFEDMVTMVEDPSGWNEKFDREQIPEMQQMFDRIFGKIVKSRQLKLEF